MNRDQESAHLTIEGWHAFYFEIVVEPSNFALNWWVSSPDYVWTMTLDGNRTVIRQPCPRPAEERDIAELPEELLSWAWQTSMEGTWQK